MPDFNALRREARAILNDTIAAARDQYESTLAAIADLQAKANGKRRRASAGMMAQAIPSGEFTQQDFLASLKALYPTKQWRPRDLQLFLCRQCRSGSIRRVSRGVYVRNGVEQPCLVDAVAAVLTRPLTVTEICVTLLEQGYRTKSTRRNFREKVFKVMRAEPGRFKRQGDKWALC